MGVLDMGHLKMELAYATEHTLGNSVSTKVKGKDRQTDSTKVRCTDRQK